VIVAARQERQTLALEALNKYMGENVDPYVGWFWNESERYERNMRWFQVATVISATITTVVAAFPLDNIVGSDKDHMWVSALSKWSIVVLSGITGVLSALRPLYGSEEIYRQRDEGRLRLAALQQKTRLKLAQIPMTDAERTKYQEEIADEIAKIEREYGRAPGPQHTDRKGERKK
jgi:hypothetical protein